MSQIVAWFFYRLYDHPTSSLCEYIFTFDFSPNHSYQFIYKWEIFSLIFISLDSGLLGWSSNGLTRTKVHLCLNGRSEFFGFSKEVVHHEMVYISIYHKLHYNRFVSSSTTGRNTRHAELWEQATADHPEGRDSCHRCGSGFWKFRPDPNGHSLAAGPG